jgi:hypothetical protein
MVKWIENAERAFYTTVWDGVPSIGLRFLDHGVAGGLLQLLYATYYFQIHFGIEHAAQQKDAAADILDLHDRVQKRIKDLQVT